MIVTIKQLSKSYGQQTVLDHVSVTLQGGKIYGLIGKNGVGKSTFLNCLSNVTRANVEEVYLNNEKISLSDATWKRDVGFVSDMVPLIDEFTIQEYLTFVGTIYRVSESDILLRAQELYNFFFEDVSLSANKKHLKSFSTGMLKKAQIISSVIHKPSILLLDEPFSGLDTVTCGKLISFLKYYSTPDTIIIFTTHDIEYHRSLATDFLVLDATHLISHLDFESLDSSYFISDISNEQMQNQLSFKSL
ncbi:MAG TPA: ABC transporter ATP-binding protein [Ohtaekwangia sp.]|uniref:ABC transporter ATP-binding protein n=1 Tax=Ohtaekwangia sp. TaxID=2066019 RepID=UPI002F95DFC4